MNPDATVKLKTCFDNAEVLQTLNVCGCKYDADGGSFDAILGGGEFIVVRYG